MSNQTPTLRQLQYFVVLADAGHYRRGAERLGISQPSLSQQISTLEDTLGISLIERRRNGLVLTPGGREVLVAARRALAEVDALVSVAQSLGEEVSGTLRLGSTPTVGPYFLPRLVGHLHAAYPDLKLIVRDGEPAALIEDLEEGRHDLVLVQLPINRAELVTRRLYREPVYLAVAKDHALARKTDVQRADLVGQDVLTLGPAYALHRPVVAMCEDVGARVRSEYEGTSLDALRQMVAMNMGVSFLPALYVRSEIEEGNGDVAVVPMRGGLYRSVGVVSRKTTGPLPLVDRFLEAAQHVVRTEFAGRISPEG